MADARVQIDTVVIGGGVAGLWTLDALRRAGREGVLVERVALGSAQTIGAQGIVHGGLKYTLAGLLTGSAEVIREMPLIWRDGLAGKRAPDLSATVMRSDFCHLWRTDSISSRLGMVGAKAGLRVAPRKLDRGEWPAVLANVPGDVLALDEQVVSCQSMLSVLAAPHADRLLLGRVSGAKADGAGVTLTLTHDQRTLTLHARHAVLTAGAGNADLRAMLGLDPHTMQRRPLHMTNVRMADGHGQLPWLNGHCVDGKKTRVTITSDRDRAGRVVWTVGGVVSEEGVSRDGPAQCRTVRTELEATIPGIDLTHAEFSTWRVDRAEPKTEGGLRPDDAHAERAGRVITAWPTKMALAPRLAERVLGLLDAPADTPWSRPEWPAPPVAENYWDTATDWRRVEAAGR